MNRTAPKLLLLRDAAEANPDTARLLADDWRRGTGNEACWCLPAGQPLPELPEDAEICEVPPVPTPGGAVWSILCRTLAAGFTPLLARPGMPGLGLAQLQQALALLDHHDAVFGMTSRDWALVGLGRAVPELFAGTSWNTSQAVVAARAQARRYRCTIAELAIALD